MPANARIPVTDLPQWGWSAAIVLWLVALASTWAWITDYEFSTYANDNSSRAEQWPRDTVLARATDRPTLLYFIHPKCPCTRASVRELRRVLDGSILSPPNQPRVIVVAGQPLGADPDWSNTDTVRTALLVPQSTLFVDEGGMESHRFGAVASGTVMLFDHDGQRTYSGGVTFSRGHQGDNPGARRLVRLLRNQDCTGVPPVPAFGCRLCLPEMMCLPEETGMSEEGSDCEAQCCRRDSHLPPQAIHAKPAR